MYNLLEYRANHYITSESLLSYCKDEVNDVAKENNDIAIYRININNTITNKSFEYKTKISRKTPDDNNRLNAEVI